MSILSAPIHSPSGKAAILGNPVRDTSPPAPGIDASTPGSRPPVARDLCPITRYVPVARHLLNIIHD
ncbi:hypothetical protein CBD41_06705 [bacterium TMED181]|nr:MAG: hypothetical protein CBD41_06705 [bacterium TMED181]